MSTKVKLKRTTEAGLAPELCPPVDADTLGVAATIVEDVRARGEVALREHAERLGDLEAGAPLVATRAELEAALAEIGSGERALLERCTERVRAFAEAQRATLQDLDVPVPGGRAGHRWLAAKSAGAYAPGGRHPLPSSVLMTVLPARVAGVESVWVASPRPTATTLAAAALAGADGLLRVGGAQAIAALAFGTVGPAADVVVGPGNRFVTAAKKVLVGEVGIDGLAGPSELLVLADGSADPRLVAADLVAQAEHDPDAQPILVTTAAQEVEAVEDALAEVLADLPTAETARASLEGRGLAVVVPDLDAAVRVADRLAPEHLQLCVREPGALAPRLGAYGGLFYGAAGAEVFGDYGAGPNHTLPTGRGARFQAGLSVATFLRASTYLEIEDGSALAPDAAGLARLEGLEGHARAAEARGGLG